MYAIVEIGGKQYKVEKDMVIDVERISVDDKKELDFEKVLMFVDGDKVTLGKPFVAGAKVKATVLEEKKGKKVLGVKFKKRKNYTRTIGHRPLYLRLKIDELSS